MALIDLKRDWIEMDRWADGILTKDSTCRAGLQAQGAEKPVG